MSISASEFESFANFGRSRLEVGTGNFSLDDLVVEWESLQNREEVNQAIREGLDDISAGRHRPAQEVMDDLLKKYEIETK